MDGLHRQLVGSIQVYRRFHALAPTAITDNGKAVRCPWPAGRQAQISTPGRRNPHQFIVVIEVGSINQMSNLGKWICFGPQAEDPVFWEFPESAMNPIQRGSHLPLSDLLINNSTKLLLQKLGTRSAGRHHPR